MANMMIASPLTQNIPTGHAFPKSPLKFFLHYTVQSPFLSSDCVQAVFRALPEINIACDDGNVRILGIRTPVERLRCTGDQVLATGALNAKHLQLFDCDAAPISQPMKSLTNIPRATEDLRIEGGNIYLCNGEDINLLAKESQKPDNHTFYVAIGA
jgi:hypothetical protein